MLWEKFLRAALTWCSEEALVCYADTLPNKLVLQMMLIFKNSLGDRPRDCKTLMEVASAYASTFHVAVDKNLGASNLSKIWVGIQPTGLRDEACFPIFP
jgi:hypothetical protein